MTKDLLDLADWRRTVAELYAGIRASTDPEEAWWEWRKVRDDLFRRHPQSPLPLEGRDAFPGVSYFAYDARARTLGTVSPRDAVRYEIPTSGDVPMTFTRFGVVEFEIGSRRAVLELYWLESYGGGLFVPFRDTTSGDQTYGAGRYLLDTAKGADLGIEDGRIVLDFNFAYNPSCSYDSRWVCPLAPPPNRLDIPIEAGERTDPV